MKFSGSKLRTLRVGAELTRDQLAEKSGISKGTIKRLENEQDVSTTTNTIQSLADALEISPIALYDLNGTNAANPQEAA